MPTFILPRFAGQPPDTCLLVLKHRKAECERTILGAYFRSYRGTETSSVGYASVGFTDLEKISRISPWCTLAT